MLIKRLIIFLILYIQSFCLAQQISFSKDSQNIIWTGFDLVDSVWVFNRSDKDLFVEDIRGANIYLYRLTVNFKDLVEYFTVFFDIEPLTFVLSAQDSAQLVFSDPDLCPICDSPTSYYSFSDTLTFYSNSITQPQYKIFVSGDGYMNLETEQSIIPTFDLSQNYPNPFNNSTTITFEIPKKEFVEIAIYNLMGEKVAELLNKELSLGK
ncbi:MAG: T9SS type A sorting domain-containing protein, partial [Bacteroidota bacterium]